VYSFIPVKLRLAVAVALGLPSIFLAGSFAAKPAQAQKDGTRIHIDASEPYQAPIPALYEGGAATAPSGATIGLNSRFLMLNGKPWLPVMGEFHFSRYPQDRWEEELLKMKAAGVNIVATYVIWIHHEEVQGQFDWNGQRDLRTFAQLCAKHGMYLLARIGPWDHAEVRNGGLPDWVLKQGPSRENDPKYLASVRAWYGQIGAQLNGLLWKDGGPVIGIQLENEYSKRGPGAGQDHIIELKRIAISSGLDVPLYIVTGWDNAVVPPNAVIPVYGGYPDAPWDNSIAKLSPAEIYAFRFRSRVTANMSAANGGDPTIAPATTQDKLPYLTAEIGGGIEDTYHRRPVIAPSDIAAMVPVMLGSGVNLYGTYMFQGGENPDGKLSTLQESQATGYPNDLPIKSYDFQAPLGEFGQERESLRKLKVFQYFLNDFGSQLAPMMVHAPEITPADSIDLATPRSSVRSKGASGFIFFNNYVRNYSMPARHAVQFEICPPYSKGTKPAAIEVPRHPIDVPSGAYFIWPFNVHFEGANLRYSTAQLFTQLGASHESSEPATFYFEAIPGIPVEFAFESSTTRTVKSSTGEITNEGGIIYVTGAKPGLESSIDITSSTGKQLRFVVLSAEQAENAWKVHIAGRDRLLITNKDFFADPDAQAPRVWLDSRTTTGFDFTITPPVTSLKASLPLKKVFASTRAIEFAADAPGRDVKVECTVIQKAVEVPPVKIGPSFDWRPHGVAQAPGPGDFTQAARWNFTVPSGVANGLSELYLEVNYQGDVARLSAEHRLLTDNFYNGRPWTIGLKRFLNAQEPSTFELSILPLRKDAPVYLETGNPLQFEANGQIGQLENIRLVPEYELEIDAGNR
jgi:beta-galactosidase